MVTVIKNIKVRTLFNGDFSKPSPLGWILIYGVIQYLAYQIIPNAPNSLIRTVIEAGNLATGAYIILNILPKAVFELRRLAIDEKPNWEWYFWTWCTHQMPILPNMRQIVGIGLILTLALISSINKSFIEPEVSLWISTLCNSFIPCVSVILIWGQEHDL